MASPPKAPQDLRIDGEVLPGRSIDLLEQALSRVKFNTDPQQLRRGLVENRLLARAVEDQLTAQSRADLDASVEIEAGNLLEQVYGRRYREDLGPYLRQPGIPAQTASSSACSGCMAASPPTWRCITAT